MRFDSPILRFALLLMALGLVLFYGNFLVELLRDPKYRDVGPRTAGVPVPEPRPEPTPAAGKPTARARREAT